MKTLSTLLTLALLSNAFGQSVTTTTGAGEVFTSDLRPLIDPDGKTIEAARGFWRASGYGYVVSITETDVSVFNETKSLLWKRQDIDADELLGSLSDNGQQARIAEHPDVPPFVLDRIDGMPENKSEPDTWTPKAVFNAFADTMSENYVFFKERSFDWNERLAQVRPSIIDAMNDAQLFDALTQCLDGLEDAHVQLGATIDGETRRPAFGLSGTEKRGIEIFQNQKEYDDFDEFLESRIQNLEAGVANTILAGNPRQLCEQLTWGVMDNNVGYLNIASMANFSDAETLDEQLSELHDAMNKILTELADTRMLIIDISTNGGGRDMFSRAIASHFVDKRRLAFTKGPRNAPEIRHAVFVSPYRGPDQKGVTYTKPIYLAINDVTMSAAEIFVLCMKDLPHVTTAGKTTRGALSDVLGKTLPNGWAFGLSNEVYLDVHGKCFEAVGIPPKVAIELIDPTKQDLGHAKAIGKLAAMKSKP